MGRILAISSQVVRGHVGLSAMVPVLHALGQDVWPVPTVLLSNHPAHPRVGGGRVPVAELDAILDALEANGWLGEVDAVVTGYLPSADHVAFTVRAIGRVRRLRPGSLVLVDPVLGDEPKGLYIARDAAHALRDLLVPLADIATPNRFELGWLTARVLADLSDVAAAAAQLPVRSMVVVTSAGRRSASGASVADAPAGNLVPAAPGSQLLTLLHAQGCCRTAAVPWRQRVPHGTGDLLAGILAGRLLSGETPGDAAARAVAGVEVAVSASAGGDELALIENLSGIVAAAPLPLEPLS